MVVKIKTNFAGEVVYELESPTLRKVLIALSDKVYSPICSLKDKRIRGDFNVYVNGIEYEELAHGIDEPLNEGDQVEVAMIVIGGG
jgi:hypothetical protein